MPDALKKPPNLVGKACLSQGADALLLDQVAVFKHVAGLVVNDSSGEMVGNIVLDGKLVHRKCIADGGGRGGHGVDGQRHEYGHDDTVDHVRSPCPPLASHGGTGM